MIEPGLGLKDIGIVIAIITAVCAAISTIMGIGGTLAVHVFQFRQYKDMLRELHHKVCGNGITGLIDRVEHIEETVDTLKCRREVEVKRRRATDLSKEDDKRYTVSQIREMRRCSQQES